VVEFQSQNLAAGTPWTLNFNGSSYALTGTSMNLTLHPGTYRVSADPATSLDGRTTYVASSFGPTVTVTATTTVVKVDYGPSYRLSAYATSGGLVSIGTGTFSASTMAWEATGASATIHAAPSTGWAFLGWSGVGTGAYSGSEENQSITVNSAIEETASFQPLPGARFNLTFQESGLPAQTEWGVTLGGVGYSTNLPTLVVTNLYAWGTAGRVGQYSLAVPYVYLNGTTEMRFAASSYPHVVGTNGTLTGPVSLSFNQQQLVTVYASAGGTAQLVLNGVPSGGTYWGATGDSVVLQEQAVTHYVFTGWVGTGTGSYTGAETSPTVTLQGGAITEFAQFTHMVPPLPPRFTLAVTMSTTLVAGTAWGITLRSSTGTSAYSTTGSMLNVTGLLNGSYTMVLHTAAAPDGLTEYLALATNPSTVTISGANRTVSLGYSTMFYVSISASAGGTVSPSSQWLKGGAPLQLQAVPTGTEQFVGWVGTGSGEYTGTNVTPTITVEGPITELAQFVPLQVHETQKTTTSIWQNMGVIAGLAVAGLVVGLLVGILLFRRKDGGAGPVSESPAPGAATPETAASPEAAPAYQETPPEGGSS
jgi:hypothetical protein